MGCCSTTHNGLSQPSSRPGVGTTCCHCLQALHGECKTTIVTYDPDTRHQPNVDKDPAENGPQRPVGSDREDDKGPLEETHHGESNKGKNLVMVFV